MPSMYLLIIYTYIIVHYTNDMQNIFLFSSSFLRTRISKHKFHIFGINFFFIARHKQPNHPMYQYHLPNHHTVPEYSSLPMYQDARNKQLTYMQKVSIDGVAMSYVMVTATLNFQPWHQRRFDREKISMSFVFYGFMCVSRC